MSRRPQRRRAAQGRLEDGKAVGVVVGHESGDEEVPGAVGRDRVAVPELDADHVQDVGHVGQGQRQVLQDPGLHCPLAVVAAHAVFAGAVVVGQVEDRVVRTVAAVPPHAADERPCAPGDHVLRVDDRNLLPQTDPLAARIGRHRVCLEGEFAVGDEFDHRGFAAGQVAVLHRAAGGNRHLDRRFRPLRAVRAGSDRQNVEALTPVGRIVDAEQDLLGVVVVRDQDVVRVLRAQGRRQADRENGRGDCVDSWTNERVDHRFRLWPGGPSNRT